MNGRHYDSLVMDDVVDTEMETEIICLVCTNLPGTNDLGLCDAHWFQYHVMSAAGRGVEFLDTLDKERLIGRVRYRYRYKTLCGLGRP